METLEITNFRGSLTRILNGDVNSGFAKFVSSFGYDPFSKPMNLTWLEAPVDITGGAITDIILAAKPRFESGILFIYAIGNSGRLYKIQPNTIGTPNLDTASVLATLSNHNMQFGASMEFYGSGATSVSSVLAEKIYIGQDDRVNSVNFDGSGESTVGSTSSVVGSRYRPLAQFVGKLLFGNSNNLGTIDSTGTVVSYAQLAPGLPQETYITDLDLSPDGNYLYVTTSGVTNENVTTVGNDRQAAAASNGSVYYWNGSDKSATASISIPSYAVTALQSYLGNNMFFSNDSFGASINNGTTKLITLTSNKSPNSNAVAINGNFLTWINPEVNAAGTGINASMYYYGNLDAENQPGLWRVMRYTTSLSAGFIYQTPVNLMTNNEYMTVNNAVSAVTTLGYGKHYFSTYEVNSGTPGTDLKKFYRFLITSTGTGTPQLGVYETQTQLFSKKITVKGVRVYTEPTATSNGFQLDYIGSDGAVITPSNGVSSYTFSAGTDVTKLQGSLERIDFGPSMKATYALGIRITNTGTTNMTIKKIEIDWEYSGK